MPQQHTTTSYDRDQQPNPIEPNHATNQRSSKKPARSLSNAAQSFLKQH